VPKQICRSHDANIHARVLEEYSERIPSGIPMSAQLLERSKALVGVFVSCLGISAKNRVGLRCRVVGKCLNKLF
jgi:hypothetical protein